MRVPRICQSTNVPAVQPLSSCHCSNSSYLCPSKSNDTVCRLLAARSMCQVEAKKVTDEESPEKEQGMDQMTWLETGVGGFLAAATLDLQHREAQMNIQKVPATAKIPLRAGHERASWGQVCL